MSKVSPTELKCDPSTSRIGIFVTMAAKVFGIVSRKFDRRHSSSSTETSSTETPRLHHRPSAVHINVPAHIYQQSSTRKLAFGDNERIENNSKKPTNDFYNNTTLATVSKLFCAIVLLSAFILVMSRSFSYEDDISSTSSSNNTSFTVAEQNSLLMDIITR